MTFRPRNQNELHKLQDEALIGHLVAARDAGDEQQMADVVAVFCFRYEPRVRAIALGKGIDGPRLDDLVQDVFESALKAAAGISGSHVGEIVNWIKTITRFKIADHYRAIENGPELESIEAGHEEGASAIEPSGPEETSASPTRIMLYELLAELPKPHRAAVVCRLAGFSSKETASMINSESTIDKNSMTPGNVDQIQSRFRRELRLRLMADKER